MFEMIVTFVETHSSEEGIVYPVTQVFRFEFDTKSDAEEVLQRANEIAIAASFLVVSEDTMRPGDKILG